MVSAVESVEARIFDQNLLREGLLGQTVDDDGHGVINSVKEEEEDAFEQRCSGKVGIDSKHKLASETRDLWKKTAGDVVGLNSLIFWQTRSFN